MCGAGWQVGSGRASWVRGGWNGFMVGGICMGVGERGGQYGTGGTEYGDLSDQVGTVWIRLHSCGSDRISPAARTGAFAARVARLSSVHPGGLGRLATPPQPRQRPLLPVCAAQVRTIAMEVGNDVQPDGYVPVICGLSRTKLQVRAWRWVGRGSRAGEAVCGGRGARGGGG